MTLKEAANIFFNPPEAKDFLVGKYKPCEISKRATSVWCKSFAGNMRDAACIIGKEADKTYLTFCRTTVCNSRVR